MIWVDPSQQKWRPSTTQIPPEVCIPENALYDICVGHIPREVLEQIAGANDIVDVIGEYFPLRRLGPAFKALCPFHQEKTPSFTVSPQRQRFKCFGCGAGGSVFDFLMLYEHLEFAAAARRLAERAGIRIIEEELGPEENAKLTLRRRLLSLHAEAADWFNRLLLKKAAAQPAREYLKGRGLNSAIAKEWKIGYAPDSWDAFCNWAHGNGYSHEEVTKSGLVSWKDDGESQQQSDAPHRIYDRFRHRIMFPICNDTGNVIAFSGRVLDADAKGAKYVNSPETMLFTKGAVLFGLHKSKRAIIDKKSAVVCEGQIDLITAFESGIENVIAPQGTAFTERQAHILKRFADEVILCFDADAAGMKAAERSLPALLGENLGVRVAEMPQGEDPDSLIRSQGAAEFSALITGARDFFEVQVDRMARLPEFATPRGRSDAARIAAGWISMVQDSFARDSLVQKVSARLEISDRELAKLIRKPSAAKAPKIASSDTPEKPAPTPLDATLRQLLTAVLHDAEAREWLLEAPWRELLAREPDNAVAIAILEADVDWSNPAATNAFLASFPSAEQALVSSVFQEHPPQHPIAVAHDCWNAIARRQVQRRMDTVRARLRASDLSGDELLKLQKESVDLRKRLEDIPRPLSPPL